MNKEEIVERLDAALPILAAKIESVTGVKVSLRGEIKRSSGYGDYYYTFESNELVSQLCGLAKPIFESIKISTWGGTLFEDNVDTYNQSFVCFRPKVDYQHYGGGRNSTDYIWSSLHFDLEKNEWDFERSKLLIKY